MDPDSSTPVAEVGDYFAILKRRKGLILACAALIGLAAFLWSLTQSTSYSASTDVRVEPFLIDPIGTSNSPARSLDLPTEVETVRSLKVSEAALDQLGLANSTPGKLRRSIKVASIEDSQILKITCTRDKPALAKACARAFADSYEQFRNDTAASLIKPELDQLMVELEALEEAQAAIEDANDDDDDNNADSRVAEQNNQARIDIMRRMGALQALEERSYVTPLDTPETQPAAVEHGASLPLNTILGLVLGGLIGVALALLRDRTDDSFRDSGESLERMGIRVLSAVPKPQGGVLRQTQDADSLVSEAHRRLRTMIMFLANRNNTRVILVTAPQTDLGLTSVTANLGVSLARAGKRVLVISASLRNSNLHNLFRLPNDRGLSAVLDGTTSADGAIQSALGMSHLGVLVAGPSVEQPAELLARPAFAELIREQLANYDLIIIEGPPVLNVSDTLAVAPYTDGVLLAVDNESTTRTDVRNAVENLQAVGGQILGAILLNAHGRPGAVRGPKKTRGLRRSSGVADQAAPSRQVEKAIPSAETDDRSDPGERPKAASGARDAPRPAAGIPLPKESDRASEQGSKFPS